MPGLRAGGALPRIPQTGRQMCRLRRAAGAGAVGRRAGLADRADAGPVPGGRDVPGLSFRPAALDHPAGRRAGRDRCRRPGPAAGKSGLDCRALVDGEGRRQPGIGGIFGESLGGGGGSGETGEPE